MRKILLSRKKIDPAAAVYTGEVETGRVRVSLFQYSSADAVETADLEPSGFSGFKSDKRQYWLNVTGLHEVEKIESICTGLKIHNLVIQDILDIHQRPKFQEFDTYWFFTLKSINPESKASVELEHLSFILGKNYLVSFQEKEGDYFDHIRERIRTHVGIVRERSADYLLYLLLEAILDNYFLTLNEIESRTESLDFVDTDVDPSPELLKTIQEYKRQIHLIRKTIIPIKDFVVKIERTTFDFIHELHVKYYLELKDLCLTLLDECEDIEQRLVSQENLFFSMQSHRMNQVMKTLTVVATIFIPLTFIAGIYGMNFTNMPELSWKWGYFGVWGVIALVFAGMVVYFRKKSWF